MEIGKTLKTKTTLISESMYKKVYEQYGDIEKMTKKEAQEGLSDRQILFCHYYLKSFNPTQAAIQVGYDKERAHINGPKLLGMPSVAKYVLYLRLKMESDLMIGPMDVLREYCKIGFADINDFAELRNGIVTLKDSQDIDGSIISEMGIGKNGQPYIKTYDKMEALRRLERFVIVTPEQERLQIEREKLKLAKASLAIQAKQKMKEQENQEDVKKLKQKMQQRKKQQKTKKAD